MQQSLAKYAVQAFPTLPRTHVQEQDEQRQEFVRLELAQYAKKRKGGRPSKQEAFEGALRAAINRGDLDKVRTIESKIPPKSWK
eukprot:1229402-Amphidinium_carterae.1